MRKCRTRHTPNKVRQTMLRLLRDSWKTIILFAMFLSFCLLLLKPNQQMDAKAAKEIPSVPKHTAASSTKTAASKPISNPSAPHLTKQPKQLIIVNKSSNQLAFYDHGKRIRTFPVATGTPEDPTPNGTFNIVNKIKNRPYYTRKIPGGNPNNPLGDRWLGLDIYKTHGTTYAIHGNNNPAAIGKFTTLGCIRMFNKDVRWLFDHVDNNTTVVIQSFHESWDSIAKKNGYTVIK